MHFSFLLALCLVPASSGFAESVPAPGPPAMSVEIAAKPSSELTKLERLLARKQETKSDLTPEQYREFLSKFRANLDAAMSRIPASPANTALYARILSRLGDSKQAVASLGKALEQDPGNPSLRLALGFVESEQKNYPAAVAAANEVLARDPANEEAQILKHSNDGRIAPSGAPGASPVVLKQMQRSAGIAADDSSKPYTLAIKGDVKPVTVPEPASESPITGSPSPPPHWPLPAGVLLTAIGGAWAMKKKLDGEGLTGPIAMTGTGLALLGISAMFPPSAPFATPEGLILVTAPAAAQVAAGTAGSAATAYGVKSGFEHLIHRAEARSADQQGSRSLDNPESLKGSTPQEVRDLIPKDWEHGPMRTGRGDIYRVPGTNGADIIQISEGNPSAPDPLHQEPYVKIVRYGKTVRIPLKSGPAIP